MDIIYNNHHPHDSPRKQTQTCLESHINQSTVVVTVDFICENVGIPTTKYMNVGGMYSKSFEMVKGGFMIPEYLYRYEDHEYANIGVRVEMRKFRVIKETPCGYWVKLFESFDDTKWVSKTAKKRFAYPTMSQALTSFKARKRRQIEILQAQINRARSALGRVDPDGEYQERRFPRCVLDI